MFAIGKEIQQTVCQCMTMLTVFCELENASRIFGIWFVAWSKINELECNFVFKFTLDQQNSKNTYHTSEVWAHSLPYSNLQTVSRRSVQTNRMCHNSMAWQFLHCFVDLHEMFAIGRFHSAISQWMHPTTRLVPDMNFQCQLEFACWLSHPSAAAKIPFCSPFYAPIFFAWL